MALMLVLDIDILDYPDKDFSNVFKQNILNILSMDSLKSEFSDLVISIYYIINGDINIKSGGTCKNIWFPFNNSEIYIVSTFQQMALDIHKIRKMESISESSKLEYISSYIGKIINLDIDNGVFRKVDYTNNPFWLNLDIGQKRQTLILWLMSPKIYEERISRNDLPIYKFDIHESSYLPNIDIKYGILEIQNDKRIWNQQSTNETKTSNLRPFLTDKILCYPHNESIGYKTYKLNNCKFIDIYIKDTIENFFDNSPFTIVLSPNSPLFQDPSENLGSLRFHLYPNLKAYPIYLKDSLKLLFLPLYATMVGLLPLGEYQPLPYITQRILLPVDFSDAKIESIKALILSLLIDKSIIAIQLDYNWFATLNPTIDGDSYFLTINILPPGLIIRNKVE
ncbi:uncharacterized protein CMU_026580 [Cryptosporidium muris RN66]|uniref:Uncharacterized protein n=1 Tax=Cryptosporidium muris (strain RN66) TaxID=441375 RepID=B6AB98_CRYMR|nr:uncharacterized protein CMU_026580 [Cryptosporidium muris RN66]EEA05650.1 hypothetical protein, conserved [Cryptosporidium muris RN66]|eukprot:XP_002139999.1 hypothetical protein [Cryptosporidium muris RN66]